MYLENLIYFELLRRGYKVTSGKGGNTEVDFIVEKQGAYQYFQVDITVDILGCSQREVTGVAGFQYSVVEWEAKKTKTVEAVQCTIY